MVLQVWPESLSARRVWIEIADGDLPPGVYKSLSARRVWIEIIPIISIKFL